MRRGGGDGGLILRFRSYDKSEKGTVASVRRSLVRSASREEKTRSITGLGIIYRLARARARTSLRRNFRSALSFDRTCHFFLPETGKRTSIAFAKFIANRRKFRRRGDCYELGAPPVSMSANRERESRVICGKLNFVKDLLSFAEINTEEISFEIGRSAINLRSILSACPWW